MLTRDAERHWKSWGKQNPYFAVLSHPDYKGALRDDDLARFYQSGEAHMDRVLRLVAARYPMDWSTGRGIDFGCGVGRLLLPLAARMRTVVGLDVSPDMLAIAQGRAVQQQCPNITLLTTAQWQAAPREGCDFLHSFIVFQHIPCAEGLRLAEVLLDRVRPGGVAALHFTTRRRLGAAKGLVYALKRHVPGALLVFNLLQGKRWNEPFMQMNEYRIEELVALFHRAGFHDVALHPEFQEGALGFYFVGRRTAGGSGGGSGGNSVGDVGVAVP